MSGLASIFIEAPDVLSNDYLNVPSYIKNQCQAQGIATTGNAVGLNSTTDFQGLKKGPTYLESGWTGRAIAAFTGCIVTGLLVWLPSLCTAGIRARTRTSTTMRTTSEPSITKRSETINYRVAQKARATLSKCNSIVYRYGKRIRSYSLSGLCVREVQSRKLASMER